MINLGKEQQRIIIGGYVFFVISRQNEDFFFSSRESHIHYFLPINKSFGLVFSVENKKNNNSANQDKLRNFH